MEQKYNKEIENLRKKYSKNNINALHISEVNKIDFSETDEKIDKLAEILLTNEKRKWKLTLNEISAFANALISEYGSKKVLSFVGFRDGMKIHKYTLDESNAIEIAKDMYQSYDSIIRQMDIIIPIRELLDIQVH